MNEEMRMLSLELLVHDYIYTYIRHRLNLGNLFSQMCVRKNWNIYKPDFVLAQNSLKSDKAWSKFEREIIIK